MSQQAIPGYIYGTGAVPRSPLSLEDFERLKQSVLFSDEDSQSLRLSYDNVSYRYLPALLYPITTTLKPFLARKGHSAEEVDKMHQAWLKSVLLQAILWSQPYIQDGEF